MYIISLIAVSLLALGGLFLFRPQWARGSLLAVTENKTLDFLLFGGASVWFLYKILNLGEADFGEHKSILFLLFASVAVGAFFYVREFLAVRGLAILTLMTSGWVLKSLFMEGGLSSLLVTSFVYISILLALYLGVVPYRLRDFREWLFISPTRRVFVSAAVMVYGCIILVAEICF